MTAVATPRAPTPRPKAPATVSFANDTTSFAPTPSTPATERLRPQLQSNPSARRSIRAAPTDFLSDRATAAFIRRVLCSQQLSDKERTTPPPIEELLPPLTSRNDVDLQLYALIAVILREYVQAWYSKITPDEAFVDEIVQIIAHCTRALEQRLRKVDLESLLFDELPDLLDKHIVDSKTPDALTGLDEAQPVKTPIFAFKLWTCISDLIELDARMPWLSGTLSMLQLGAMKGPGRVAALNGPMDRLISHTIHQRVLDAAYLPTLLRSIRAALFPNNAPGVSTLVAPSSDQELRALRRRCASAVLARIPPWLARLYLGGRGLGLRWRSGPDSRATGAAAEAGANGDDTAAAGGPGSGPGSSRDANVEAVATGTSDCDSSGDENGTKSQPPEDDEDQQQMLSEIEEGILDVFSDEYCNKHFVYGMLELILVRLMPELAEKGVVELWEERLSL
ncbi:hypothetical protein K4K49_001015 [Colletotrichum sp. SAR 10_70]|nr:hypothetical protein K4K50_008625 [Colletotrichum sp. SAR 10_71]KAI8200996.1 hypothetical protein K4K49_001015 [Colletotrichum sp. SAR 10_70]KAI8212268.1 hypothetical protein K4K52_008599 [Colletotrichum sp. SAR 10_76]KAI8231555.1 hypothetical protein K4K54_013046 [Colletotrichum sp. SAR 10_86]KAI8269057.1 hypothetical protein K4K58_003057 [Colletotrichum sp. SAR11_239]